MSWLCHANRTSDFEGTVQVDIYSLTLAASMGALGVAFVLLVLTKVPQTGFDSSAIKQLYFWSRRINLLALLLLIFSFAVHLTVGHRPGSPTAMAAIEFFREHSAFIVIALLIGILFLLLKRKTS